MMNELTNIIDELIPQPILNDAEKHDMLETFLQMFDDAITEDPGLFVEPAFDDIISQRVLTLFYETLGYETLDLYTLEAIHTVLSEAYEIYGTSHIVRSFPRTMILNEPDVEKMKIHMDYLKNIPQPEQRTDDWYHFRYKYLTASSIWKVFGTPRTQNELIYDKCKPLDISKYATVNTDSPLHWGQKYEDISLLWYEREYMTKVSDFGCLPHRNISYLAASPDGIVTDSTSNRFGRMLEIKNIVNRDITGIPKKEYWIQMQIQMEVCELDECDFLETRFKEYDNYKHFITDGTFTHTAEGKMKGIMLYFNNSGLPLYEYAPLGITEKDYQCWETTITEKHSELTLVRSIYWWLDEVSCVLVLRNRTWFNHVKPVIDEFWGKIIHDRKNGYEHRAPQRKNKTTISVVKESKKCMIDIDSLDTESSGVTTNSNTNSILDVNSMNNGKSNIQFNIETI